MQLSRHKLSTQAARKAEKHLNRHKLSSQVRLSLSEDEYVTDPTQTVVSRSTQTASRQK